MCAITANPNGAECWRLRTLPPPACIVGGSKWNSTAGSRASVRHLHASTRSKSCWMKYPAKPGNISRCAAIARSQWTQAGWRPGDAHRPILKEGAQPGPRQSAGYVVELTDVGRLVGGFFVARAFGLGHNRQLFLV